MMRTYSPKASEIQRAWHVIDAEGLVLAVTSFFYDLLQIVGNPLAELRRD